MKKILSLFVTALSLTCFIYSCGQSEQPAGVSHIDSTSLELFDSSLIAKEDVVRIDSVKEDSIKK